MDDTLNQELDFLAVDTAEYPSADHQQTMGDDRLHGASEEPPQRLVVEHNTALRQQIQRLEKEVADLRKSVRKGDGRSSNTQVSEDGSRLPEVSEDHIVQSHDNHTVYDTPDNRVTASSTTPAAGTVPKNRGRPRKKDAMAVTSQRMAETPVHQEPKRTRTSTTNAPPLSNQPTASTAALRLPTEIFVNVTDAQKPNFKPDGVLNAAWKTFHAHFPAYCDEFESKNLRFLQEGPRFADKKRTNCVRTRAKRLGGSVNVVNNSQFACEICTAKKVVCAIVSANAVLKLLPLQPADRDPDLGPQDVGYWIKVDQD